MFNPRKRRSGKGKRTNVSMTFYDLHLNILN